MSNSKMYPLTAYGQTVKDLAGLEEDEVKEEDLIEIPQLRSITFNDLQSNPTVLSLKCCSFSFILCCRNSVHSHMP